MRHRAWHKTRLSDAVLDIVQFGNSSHTNIDQSPAVIINGTRFRSARELEFVYRITF